MKVGRRIDEKEGKRDHFYLLHRGPIPAAFAGNWQESPQSLLLRSEIEEIRLRNWRNKLGSWKEDDKRILEV